MKIYFVSKLHHAHKFKEWALNNPNHHVVSKWIYSESEFPQVKEHAVNFWVDDFRDIDFCDAVVVYVENGEKLRGGLVEVGYAIAREKKIILIGDHPDWGTWHHYIDDGFGRVHNLQQLSGRLSNGY